ncbi:MAG: hypothetical protein FWE80_01680 [Oscillospiraceae bacterium]|nr:hypothetical protein [Oscillospiraceae bacterium]
MKKTLSLLAISALLFTMTLAFVACGGKGKLDGRYYLDGNKSVYFEFNDYEVTARAEMFGQSFTATYTYQIIGNRLILSADGQTEEYILSKDRNEFSDPDGSEKYIKRSY